MLALTLPTPSPLSTTPPKVPLLLKVTLLKTAPYFFLIFLILNTIYFIEIELKMYLQYINKTNTIFQIKYTLLAFKEQL